MNWTVEAARTVRGWTRVGVVLFLGIAATGTVGWMRRPAQEPASTTPAVASVGPAVSVPVTLPESLFQIPQMPGKTAPVIGADVASKVSAQWSVKGIDIGPPPTALLAETESKRSVWVSEGDRAGALTIRRIEPGQVTVESEDGESILRF